MGRAACGQYKGLIDLFYNFAIIYPIFWRRARPVGKSLSVWFGLLLIFGLTGFLPAPQDSQPNITVLDRSGKSIQALTDGDQVQLEIRLSSPAASAQEITFTFQGEPGDLAVCTVPGGQAQCRTDPLLTLGWRWGENGASRPARTLEARDAAGNTLGASGSISVAPRPVILVHGFISTWETWKSYLGPQGFLASLGLPAYAIGDGQVPGQLNTGSLTDPTQRTNTIQQNAQILGDYIAAVKQKTGAQMVDLVVHSMGGMISRYYIDRVMERRDVGQLVMLGSPMGGSDCSVLPASLGFYLPASLEIRSSYMLGVFNRQITHRHGVPFYDLAGTQILEAYQSPCAEVPNDTVVSLGSVNAIPLASTQIKAIHSDLTTSPAVFQDFVQPLLKNPPGHFPASADAGPSASTGAPLQFTRVYRGHVEAGGSTELTINIEANISVAAFALYDPTRSTAVSVRGASGNVIALDPQTNGFIRIEDPASMLYLGYGFSNPKPGPWKVTVLATDATPAPGADFAISVYFVGGASLQAASDTLIPAAGSPVTWTASLTLGGEPVEIRQGQVLIRRPDGGQETLEMQAGMQSINTWTPPSPGTYGIDLVVTGQAPDGTPIERTAFLAIEAQPAAGTDKAATNLALLIGGVVLLLALLIFLLLRLIRAVSRRGR